MAHFQNREANDMGKNSANGLSSEQRLLRAMITLNAINNGRPVPDFNKIEGGWVTKIDPNASAKETGKQIKDKARSAGWPLSNQSGDTFA